MTILLPTTIRVAAAVGLVAVSLETGSCGSARPATQTAASSIAATAASAAPSSATSASSGAAASASSEANAPAPGFEPSTIHALLADPALADAARAVFRKDWTLGADAIGVALATGKLAEADVPRAHFLRAHLLAQAKSDDAALAELALVAEPSPLAVHARLRRAGLLAKKTSGADAVLALLETVPDAAPFASDRRMALGEALAAKGDHAGAARSFAPERSGARWIDASIRYAEETAAQGAAAAAQALDAAQGARKVRFAAPLSALIGRAFEAESKCRALLSAADAATLGNPTLAEQTTAATAMLDAGRAKDAAPVIEQALKSAGKLKGKEPWCRAALVQAKVLERTKEKAEASDVYGAIATACTDEASRVAALYDGGKIALSLKHPEIARARFALLEKDYPTHRLADDARLRGANAAIDAGDVAHGEAMLAALPDDYPSGDLRTEALFRLALPRMKAGDWKGALPILERSLAIAEHEEGYFVAGRTAYFLGRAWLETGEVERGVARLERVVVEEPLSFSAAMAYVLLSGRGADETRKVRASIDAAIAAEPAGPLWAERPELQSPGFSRAIELARVGETEAARKELAALGLFDHAATDPDGLWIGAALFAAAGDARASHGFARNRLTDWSKHFPGGKWRAAWEIAYPRPWLDTVQAASAQSGVPSTLLWSVMREESAFDPEAVSPSAAHGLLQLILPTATAYAKALKLPSDARSLAVPEINVPIGAAYLHKLRAEFDRNPALAIPSYNAGEGATRRWMNPPLAPSFDLWVESIPYEETRKYTKRVLTSFYAYVALYDAPHLDDELRAAAGK